MCDCFAQLLSFNHVPLPHHLVASPVVAETTITVVHGHVVALRGTKDHRGDGIDAYPLICTRAVHNDHYWRSPHTLCRDNLVCFISDFIRT
jgi:hypothetical protein